jgi:signal transduction histidine kinase
MDHEPTTTAAARVDDDTHELLKAIHEQGRQTFELVRAIVSLLMPKEGGREGPALEDLLAKLVAQQQQIITLGKATQADLNRLGKTLPGAVADAIEGHRALRS